MRHILARILLAGASLTFALASPAQNSVSASFQNFSYTLTDLDPLDGIAPSLTWLDTSYSGSPSARATLVDLATLTTTSNIDEGAQARSPVLATASVPGLNVRASLNDTHTPAMRMSASIDLSSAIPTHDAFAEVRSPTLGFVLSPFTSVLFSIDGVIEQSIDTTTIDPAQNALSFAQLALEGYQDVLSDNRYHADLELVLRPGEPAMRHETTITPRVENLTGIETSNSIGFRLLVSSIPEPAEYAMLAAGLIFLSLRLRGRSL